MFDFIYGFAFALGLFTVVGAVALVLRAGARLADAERRLAALEARLAEQVKPHTRIARERLDIGEGMLFQMAKLRMELDRDQATLDSITSYAQFISRGGDPDAPAAEWKRSRTEETK